MNRRSFLSSILALAVAPIAAFWSSLRGVEHGDRRPAPDYSQATWGNIPMNDLSVDKIVLLSKRRTVVLTRKEYMNLQERKAKRA